MELGDPDGVSGRQATAASLEEPGIRRRGIVDHDADHARAQVKTRRTRKHRRLELLLIAAGVAATLIAAAYQYFGIRSTLESSTAASLYAQQQEIDKIFVENVDLQPYFWRRHELPDPAAIQDPAARREAQQLAARSEATAHRILDHFALLTPTENRARNAN